LHKIGEGACGSVWSHKINIPRDHMDYIKATNVAFKRGDGSQGRALTQEAQVYCDIEELSRYCPKEIWRQFQIPKFYAYLDANSGSSSYGPLTYNNNMDDLVSTPLGLESCNTLAMERIPSLGRPVQHMLWRVCTPAAARMMAASQFTEVNLLIRPYMGCRRPNHHNAHFNMRDFILTLTQLEFLMLEPDNYIKSMAKGLAFLNFGAQYDGKNIDWAIACPRASSCHPEFDHTLWMLDFNNCQPMSMNEAGVWKVAKAFWHNKPYYPRPGKGRADDEKLWQLFRKTYVDAAQEIIVARHDNAERMER
ncbi:zinc finger protein-domain-containing protein, partial [Pseudomassariella vexata]